MPTAFGYESGAVRGRDNLTRMVSEFEPLCFESVNVTLHAYCNTTVSLPVIASSSGSSGSSWVKLYLDVFTGNSNPQRSLMTSAPLDPCCRTRVVHFERVICKVNTKISGIGGCSESQDMR